VGKKEGKGYRSKADLAEVCPVLHTYGGMTSFAGPPNRKTYVLSQESASEKNHTEPRTADYRTSVHAAPRYPYLDL
jgi:hypothetical protein